MIHRLKSTVRKNPWLWGLASGLVLAIAVTAIFRMYAVQSVETNIEERQQHVVTSTLDAVDQKFSALLEKLSSRAKGLAHDPVVAHGLRRWHDTGEAPTPLVEALSRRSLPSYTAVEVYSPSQQAVTWSGVQMPLDSTRLGKDSPEQPTTTIVTDDVGRRAVALWWPIQEDGQVLGAVRLVRITEYQPPVQNRYVQAVSLEGQWARDTGELVRIHWTSNRPPSPHRALRGVDGSVLAYATVEPPSPDHLVNRTASFYSDLLVVWVVLLLGLGFVLSGWWYHVLGSRNGLRRHARARTATAGRLIVVTGLAVALRYALVVLDVPARWVPPGSVLAPLFNPTHLASAIAGGAFRSIGDLLLTGIWATGIGAAIGHLGRHYRPEVESIGDLLKTVRESSPREPHAGRYIGTVVFTVVGGLGGLIAVAYVVRRAVLDSTLDFFSRTGLLPEPLVLGVFAGLFLLVAAGILGAIGGMWIGTRRLLDFRPIHWPGSTGPLLGVFLFVGAVAVLYGGTDIETLVSLPYTASALTVLGILGMYGVAQRGEAVSILTLRGLLAAVFLATLLLYPLLYAGMDAKRKEHMVDVAHSFEEGQDPRVVYSIRQILRSASETLVPLLRVDDSAQKRQIDSVATGLVRESLLTSLAPYDVQLSLLGPDGDILGQYTSSGKIDRPGAFRGVHSTFSVLRQLYDQRPGLVIEELPQSEPVRATRLGRYEYAGLLGRPIGPDSGNVWVLVRIEPQSMLPGTDFGVPRVLLPNGSFGDLYANISLAEFHEGRLVRSFGEEFGRTRLRLSDRVDLAEELSAWRKEVVRERQYLTYYHHVASSADGEGSIIAVRIPAILGFDHLYYLLRLTIAGLCVGLFVYLLGLYLRFRQGRLPAKRVRFRNKVLNAFLVVGIVSMGAVGVVGVRVVTGENDRVIERQIQDELSRVEETLVLEAKPGERLWRVAERINIDSLAARVGLDLHLYRDQTLVRTSQPRLLRDGLVGERLPGDVYHALHSQSYRFVIDDASIGQFGYRVGYRALLDSDGRTRLVVAVPTLAQQEQLQEEQSRTLAYLFGALLLLVVVVMLTGVVLANALAQPIAQLREGLKAVGKGQFARTLSVHTRDEIGDLVQTFNRMRDQLAESRRKLARQERELAWREMARQVAHEIKNPLTPMKLSIQHLRRAFERTDDPKGSSDFSELFDRITRTLIEQVESLVRIANEFSTFARLPTRVTEPVDLNDIVREAVSLMEEETKEAASIELELEEGPLVVEADRQELRRIYINLLKNALQAIPDGRDGHVQVRTECVERDQGPMVQSLVADNGTGIPPGVQSKIFEPNFSTKTGGTGLGLAIAKKGITELGGDISFETTEGEGTTFWIRLPAVEEER